MTIKTNRSACRPPTLRRSWLFVAGLDQDRQREAMASGADVIVADLEEFTAPADRPAARARIVALMAECRAQGIVGAVRINKLDEDGLDDLRGVMPGAPAAVFLPHAETATQMQLLALEITVLERELGLAEGQTEIVPTLESARGVVAAPSILSATPRISACLLAAGDLGADLDVVNGPDAVELQHVRARFLVDCIAAGCVPIDSPCNYRRPGVIEAELAWARRIGLKAKCTVFPDQVAAIHAAFTPSARQATDAAALVTAFEAARDGQPADGPRVEIPDANTARRLLARHASFAAWARTSGSTGPA